MAVNYILALIVAGIYLVFGIENNWIRLNGFAKENKTAETYWGQHGKLVQKILSNYSLSTRPVVDESDSVHLLLHVDISHIEKIDESEGTISVHGFIHQVWEDQKIKWSDAKIESIKFRSDKIWTPNLKFLNSAMGKESYISLEPYSAARITRNGKVKVESRFSVKAQCDMDFTDYPYDKQVCPLILYTGEYFMSEVNIDPMGYPGLSLTLSDWDKDMSNKEKVHASGWVISNLTNKLSYHFYAIGDGFHTTDVMPKPMQPYTYKHYQVLVHLSRYAPYFGLTVLLPCLITAILTVSSFIMETHEIALYTLLANFLVQLLFLADLLTTLPATVEGTPKIVQFYAFNVVITVLAFCLHIILQYLQMKTGELDSNLLKISRFREYLPRISNEEPNVWKDFKIVLHFWIAISYLFIYCIVIFVLLA